MVLEESQSDGNIHPGRVRAFWASRKIRIKWKIIRYWKANGKINSKKEMMYLLNSTKLMPIFFCRFHLPNWVAKPERKKFSTTRLKNFDLDSQKFLSQLCGRSSLYVILNYHSSVLLGETQHLFFPSWGRSLLRKWHFFIIQPPCL